MKWQSLARLLYLLCLGVLLQACPPELVEPAAGSEGGRCLSDASCDAGLTCLSGRCVILPSDAGGIDSMGNDRVGSDATIADSGTIPDGSCAGLDGGIGSCAPQCGNNGECPLDILFVVDNSGSMSEEQDKLATAASTLIMQLDMRGNPYHIGVISTDMNDCDFADSASPRPSVPQRGCLQSSPQDPSLTVLTWQTAGAASKLADIIRSIGTTGSPYEKGLGAVAHFLTPDHSVPASNACQTERDCSDDLDAFLRQRASNAANETIDSKLVLVFLTDEDDCTHGGRIDEMQSGNTALCYTEVENLTAVSDIVAEVKQRKRSPELISVATIAGLMQVGSNFVASGCKIVDSSASNDCNLAMGNSIATCSQCIDGSPICSCHPALTCPEGEVFQDANCCQADPASRYLQFAQNFTSHVEATLCDDTYSNAVTLIVDAAL